MDKGRVRRRKNKHLWTQFRYPFITDITSLQEYVDNDAIFVAMDILGGDVITELAISVLPPSALRRLASGEKPPADVNDLAEKYGLDTYSYRIHGKYRVKVGKGLRGSILQFGEIQWVDENELVDVVTAKVLSLWNHYAVPVANGKSAPPLVLVGYSMDRVAHHLIQGLKPVIEAVPLAACFDISTLLLSMATTRRRGVPSMKLTMQTAGLTFRENNTLEQVAAGQFEDLGWRKLCRSGHNSAGNDVVFSLSVLAQILHAGYLEPMRFDSDLSVKMPLLDRLRLLTEVPEPPPYSGPTKEEMIDMNKRKSRLAGKKELENALKDLDSDLSSSLGMLELDGW
ncbi:hypothetical protein F503_05945 [Ophiostoma piceae UAMH 11346]|uniref:Qde-2-interacting protein n=1 Tax=Ophiostoma piceae (strain UAMH 11346) TaxID=1262450 RepID=S3DBC2_OPHP1|nr:hypothetical protein F503_05945 [Ophiostoma piceae UAMH 11346]